MKLRNVICNIRLLVYERKVLSLVLNFLSGVDFLFPKVGAVILVGRSIVMEVCCVIRECIMFKEAKDRIMGKRQVCIGV